MQQTVVATRQRAQIVHQMTRDMDAYKKAYHLHFKRQWHVVICTEPIMVHHPDMRLLDVFAQSKCIRLFMRAIWCGI